ncbi:ATP-binding protein [Microcoleus sp. FACHB-831]|uniref:ATP-binding protein n=1 Tax=Microcoleus sp. FACHB-831 TaxID=2692827 RepID=UPI00168604DE|nr:anti-sigma regulatory factor [Microcoleus sp. FACHB-831]MBD1920580.1 ATP-binding protein [Microcoleus sp. FACHB-831]
MKPLKKTFLQFPSDLHKLDDVLSWFEELNHPSIPLKVWLQCQLALAEGFTNAVRHAHKGLASDVLIGIEVTLFPECLEIRIWDSGPPFDLEGRIKILCETPDETAGSGRGIAILHKIADQLSYTRTNDQRNCLLIVKHY